MGDEIEMGSPSDEIGAAVDHDGLVDCVVRLALTLPTNH